MNQQYVDLSLRKLPGLMMLLLSHVTVEFMTDLSSRAKASRSLLSEPSKSVLFRVTNVPDKRLTTTEKRSTYVADSPAVYYLYC